MPRPPNTPLVSLEEIVNRNTHNTGNCDQECPYVDGSTIASEAFEAGRLSTEPAKIQLLKVLVKLYESYCSVMRSEFDSVGRPWTPERDNDEAAMNARSVIAGNIIDPTGFTKKQRESIESAIRSLRYGAHPHRSPHADDLETMLGTGPVGG